MIWWLDNKRQLLLKKHDVSKRLVCGRECEALVDLNEIFIEDNLRFLSPLALNNFSIKSFNPRHVVCWEFFVNCFYLILNGLCTQMFLIGFRHGTSKSIPICQISRNIKESISHLNKLARAFKLPA